MSTQDNNLLGFLKKKSLFNQSPVRHPNGKRSRSKSKDLKESIIRKINEKDIDGSSEPITIAKEAQRISKIMEEDDKFCDDLVDQVC